MIELDIGVLGVQAATFLVALGLLRWLAYKPLMSLLDERARRVSSDLDAADNARRAAEQAVATVEQERQEILRSSDALLRQATEEGRLAREKILRDAQQQGASLLADAERRIAEERDRAVRELRGEASDLAVRLAEKVMAESLSQSAHDRLVNETVAALEFPGEKDEHATL